MEFGRNDPDIYRPVCRCIDWDSISDFFRRFCRELPQSKFLVRVSDDYKSVLTLP